MSHKIDERKDNIRKIKETIENTKDNIEFTNDMIDTATLDVNHTQLLKQQNKRRAESVDALQTELKEQIVGKEKKNK